jgi:hypothetical protein
MAVAAKRAGKVGRATRDRTNPATPTFGQRTFDARPDRLDIRDLPYRPPLNSLPPRFPDDASIRKYLSSYVRAGLILDQGTEGACTGFGLACVVNYLLWVTHADGNAKTRFEAVSPRMLYEMAKRYDEWPGQDYEGSSCRGALKGWHKHGVCSEARWPYSLSATGEPVFVRPRSGWEHDAVQRPLGVYYRINRESVVDLQAAVVDIGAVYVSGDAHDGWDELLRTRSSVPAKGHAGLPVIPPPKDPRDLGGHAFAIVGYNERGFVVQNSWGRKWGAAGFGILPYDDWIEHATDAWACALGVPVLLPNGKGSMRSLVASRWPIASGRSLTRIERAARNPANPPDDPWPIDHEFEHKEYQPWSSDNAYEHTLVSGNDGKLVVSDLTRSSADAVGHAQEIVVENPLRWFKSQSMPTLKLALYAHGGLNDEQASIRRIRVLAPYFAANGIYPLFLTWKTGAGETLKDLVQDWARKALGVEAEKAAGLLEILGDAKDRAIEALGHVLGKGIWSEMRENAEFGKLQDHLLNLLARNLAALSTSLAKSNAQLELHLLGHSAGSILLGHLLDQIRTGSSNGPPLAVKTCTLFAAACSTRFAVDKYLPAAKAGVIDLRRLWLHYLTDQNEKRDGLPTPGLAAYGKSLLYLVSRALDDVRKMPLLGMHRALDLKYANDDDQWAKGELQSVQEWQSEWKPTAGPTVLGMPVATPTVRNTRAGGQTQSTHGSFDNNIDALTNTLRTIRGADLVAPMEWLDY